MIMPACVSRLLTIALAAIVIAPSSAHCYVVGGPKRTPEEILALPGGDFGLAVSEYARDAIASDNKAAVPGLWRLFDRAAKERRSAGYPGDISRITEAIGFLGSEADLGKLLGYYDSESNDYVRLSVFLVPLSNIFARMELERATAGGRQSPLLPDQSLVTPGQLQGASQGLHSAWLQYETVRKRFEPLVESRALGVNASKKQGISELYRTIGSSLRGEKPSITDELAGYYWEGMCGTFSESLYTPKYLGLFMSLLKEQRYHEALGALMAFEREHTQFALNSATAKAGFGWKRRFIEFCGYDWEDLYAASQFDYSRAGHLLNCMAAYGSDRSANYIADLIELPDPKSHAKPRYVRAATRLIDPAPGHSPQVLRFSFQWLPRTGPPISQPVQDRLLALIVKQVAPDMSEDMADACSQALADLRRPDTRDALRILATSPFYKYRQCAGEALKAMGETVTIVPEEGPVRFRLLDHGRPLGAAKVNIELYYEGSEYPGLSTQRTLSKDGIIEINHDYFADPSKKVTGIALRASASSLRSGVHPEDPVMLVWQPTPPDLSAVTTESVDFAKLTINFRFAEPTDLKWSFTHDSGQGPKAISYMWAPVTMKDLPAGGQIVFPKVGRGLYKLQVTKKGSYKPLVSRPFEMTGKDQVVDLSE